MKKIKITALILCISLLLCSCGEEQTSVQEGNGSTTVACVPTDTRDMFSDRDCDSSVGATATVITLRETIAKCDDSSVSTVGGCVTITAEGVYTLSGSLTNGSVIVDAPEKAKVQLVLDGADIKSNTSAAIYIKEADKVFITLKQDSKNTLSNGGSYEATDDGIDSVIFSKADLSFNGKGNLTINAKSGHGIVSKDDLVFTDGTYNITSASHGITANDSIRIKNGSFTVESGKDGFHAENGDDSSLGFLYVADGSFNIKSTLDGMSASSYALIDNGDFRITSGGGSENAPSQESDFFMHHPGYQQTTTQEDTESLKGIKASADLTIKSGEFNLNCADDAIHSNGNARINGGHFTIATGDDGFHADNNLSLSSGVINVTESYEGLEGMSIDISGGKITLISSDDGLNAAGGNDQSGYGGEMKKPDSFGGPMGKPDEQGGSFSSYIKISGGEISINADGDGIDSNGSLEITGGTIFVWGPENNGNSALDYASSASISGGTFISTGPSGMAQNFSSSTQGTMMINTNTQQSGAEISLSDSTGKQVVSAFGEKSFNSVIISSPDIKEGETYTLIAGDYSTEIQMTTLLYSTSGRSSVGGDMPGGWYGGWR